MDEIAKTSGGTVLYQAGTESLVAEASSTSTFEKMITVAYSHSTVETFSKEVHDTEKQIKKDFDIKSMPGPWRSSKSVVFSAMRLKIPLIDDNGVFYGKTSLQNKIKAAKTEPKEEATPQEWAAKAIAVLNKVPDKMKETTFDIVADYLNSK